MKAILTGNEAVARGAYEAGLCFASAYPGTPSTEILENLVQYKDELYCEWAPNEKVALEAAIGASVAGVRSMAAMKHVGVNVAADPLFTFAYTGVTGGCVLVSADDPGMHSSQNEQDNRNYAQAARVLMLNPADSQESKDFMKLGLELSERFDTPVMLHMTTRVCHSKGLIELEERVEKAPVSYTKNIRKYVATPANAKVMRGKLEDRIKAMTEYANTADINRPEYNDKKIGVVSSGVAYQYARDVFGASASYLKLGMSWPVPVDLIREFAAQVETLYVVEEMDPYLERHIKEAGIQCIGKEMIPSYDELNPDVLRKAVFGSEQAEASVADRLIDQAEKAEMAGKEEKTDKAVKAPQVVGRPPTLCAGCPHRGFFYALSKKKDIIITGDIGCYTLGSAEPLNAMDTCFCMGGSISSGHGASVALRQTGRKGKAVAVIGDSTFFHSGVNSLMDVVFNKGNSVSVILDNRITAMTGHQQNPGTGFTITGEPATQVDIPLLCKAIGIKEENIYKVNPLMMDRVHAVLDEALAKDEPTVIITRWPCILKKFSDQDKAEFKLDAPRSRVNQEKCKSCLLCTNTGCPAIYASDKVRIDEASCTGCTVCRQVCPFDAIEAVKEV